MPESLRVELIAPAEARRGAPVSITLRLRNLADHPVDAYFLGRTIAFDIVVRDSSGTVVWRRLERETVQGILQIRTLQPGEVLEWRDEWRQNTDPGPPVSPGRYTLQGVLPTDGEPLRSEERELRIRP